MTEKAAVAASEKRMPDAEKLLDEQRSAVDDIPNKVEPQAYEVNSSEKAEDSNSSEEAEDAAEKKNKGSLRDYFRIFQYADRLDFLLYAIAIAGAIAVGATLPLMTLVFGSSTSSFNDYAVGQGNPQQFQDNINHLVLYFVYLFIGRFIIGYVSTLCICVAAARTTNSLRKAFPERLLRQEVSH